MIIPTNEEKNIKLDTIKIISNDEEIGRNGSEYPTSDDPNDTKLCRKLDLHLLPIIILLYLLNFLDRVNIGQAKIVGLPRSLKLTSAQFNICVSIVFVTYVIFEIPSNLILKNVRPSRWIPLTMVTWGTIMTLTGLVNSYVSLIICRLLLGAAESGVFPGIIFYLSSWYKRAELSWRVSMLFSSTTLGGVFGGVLAFAIGKMNGLGGQEGWRWIFYIEGIITVVVGVLSFFLVKDFPSNRPKFLTEEQCNRIIIRLNNDAGPGACEHFSWKQVRAVFTDWKIYVFCLCYIGIDTAAYSLSFFTPTIVESLGFSSYRAQLMSAPPYAFAFLTTMTTAYFSDKYARRAIFIIFWLVITIIGFIILIFVENLNIKYFGVFLTAGGTSPCVATCITFLSGNVSPHTKRSTALAFMLSVGNCGGIISGQIYRTQDAPNFILGHAINLGFCGLSLITCIILLITLNLENRRRDNLYGSVDINNSLTNLPTANSNKEIVDILVLGTEDDRRKWGYENMSEKDLRDLGDKHVAWRYIL